MKGYITTKRGRYYAVSYQGLDPVTGQERRTWHPAGTHRAEAERLAERLTNECNGRNDEIRSLTFGAYLTRRWLPGKKLTLRTSTYRSYVHKTERHILRALGSMRLRALRPSTSRSCTTGCRTPPTAAGRWHPRPSTKSTSSSAAPLTTASAAG